MVTKSIRSIPRSDWQTGPLHPLTHIPDPPETLYYQGNLPGSHLALLTVVGSRQYSSYGKQVVTELIAGLAQYPIGIISGLARGIDGLAHEAALHAGLYTLAIPGSGLGRSVLYPARHRGLAEQILQAGGGLLSELPPNTRAARWTFPQRNRVMAGLAQATLLIEAAEKSGTLITARLCVEYDRELLVTPGNIFSPLSYGTHQFLKLGATPVTTSADIVSALQLEHTAPDEQPLQLTRTEAAVFDALQEPVPIDVIIKRTDYTEREVSTALMALEMKSYICSSNGLYHRNI